MDSSFDFVIALLVLPVGCEKKPPIDVTFDSTKGLIDAIVADRTMGKTSTTVLAPGGRLPVEDLRQAWDARIGKQTHFGEACWA